jgi:hypothetical protein
MIPPGPGPFSVVESVLLYNIPLILRVGMVARTMATVRPWVLLARAGLMPYPSASAAWGSWAAADLEPRGHFFLLLFAFHQPESKIIIAALWGPHAISLADSDLVKPTIDNSSLPIPAADGCKRQAVSAGLEGHPSDATFCASRASFAVDLLGLSASAP